MATMFHLGHQIMVYMDSYNEKHYIRLCKHEYSRNQTNIYPTKAGITISNPEGLDMFQKILNTKSIQDWYQLVHDNIKDQLEKKDEIGEASGSKEVTFFN